MQTLILSTCGTSLLNNLARDDHSLVGLITSYANARKLEEIPVEDRAPLNTLIEEARQALSNVELPQKRRLSAELNGLLRYYGGHLGSAANDLHWLIATDTWLGKATAEAIADVLEAAGKRAEIKCIRDMRTDSLDEFRAAMAELTRLCAEQVRSYRQARWRVVFNLTGGFKSVQGFMQALGMLYADESVFVFERTDELLRLPRLPISLDSAKLVRDHQHVFRRLAAGPPVTIEEANGVCDTLLMEDSGQMSFSVWGDLVKAEAGKGLLEERLWEPVDEKLRFGPGFERTVGECEKGQLRQINERLGDLARRLGDSTYNPVRLDFKKLKGRQGPSTHECDASASGSAKRLFGHFVGDTFVLDALDQGLH